MKFINEYLLSNLLIENGEKKDEIASKLWFHFPLISGKRISNILLPFKFLYKKFVVLLIILAVVFLQLYFLKLGCYSINKSISIYNINSINIIVIVFISFFVHELGHVVAALYYKIPVGDMGIGLYLFRPVFYTDLSNAWKLDRRKRVVTDLGGIYFQIISILILSIFMFFYNTVTLRLSILLIMISVVGNINPVLRFDGYWVITDFLGIVNIDKRAIEVIKSLMINLIKNREIKLEINIEFKKGLRTFFYLYVFLYIVFTIGMVALGFYIAIKSICNINTFITSFELIYESIYNKDLGMFISRVNNSLIILLPLLYIILFLGRFIKSLFKIKIVKLNK